MAEVKFTPGPWKAEDGGFVEAGDSAVCQMWDKMEEDFPNAVANASLIAAAPSLYEALEALRDEFHEMALCARAGNPPRNIELVEAAEAKADAALKLATSRPRT